jgi:hypothetical protein
VAFLVQLAVPGGVQHDPGVGGFAEPPALLVQDLRVDGVLAGGAGGVGCLLECRQGVDGLPRPDDV